MSIRSSVLGGEPISEVVGYGGGKRVSYVRVGKSILAHLIRNYVWQPGGGYSFDAVYYEHTDSSGMSYRMTERQMPFGYGDYSDARQAEFDAGGTNVGLVTNYNPPPGDPPENFAPLEDTSPLWINGQRVTATLDGMAISWQMVRNLINSPRIGGEIGLTEILGRQSDANWHSNYRVKFNDGDRSYTRYFGNDLASAETFALRMNQTTVYAHLNVSNSAWFGFGSFPRPQTQQQGFKLGDKGVAFTVKEKSLLNAAFKYVNSKKCLDWINKTLEPFIKSWDEGGQKGTAPFAMSATDLISKVSINKYSRSLTAQQMGLTPSQRKNISDNENSLYFWDGFVGVNNGDQVWLQDIAFRDYAGLGGDKTDLPASIVHELFHAFGFKDEKYVKGLNKEIQDNCGWGGYVGGGL